MECTVPDTKILIRCDAPRLWAAFSLSSVLRVWEVTTSDSEDRSVSGRVSCAALCWPYVLGEFPYRFFGSGRCVPSVLGVVC